MDLSTEMKIDDPVGPDRETPPTPSLITPQLHPNLRQEVESASTGKTDRENTLIAP